MKIYLNDTEIEFKKLSLKDREKFLVEIPCKFISCEFSFTNLFIWSDSYKILWAEYNNKPLVYNESEDLVFFPLSYPHPEELIKISKAIQAIGKSGIVTYVPPEYIEEFPIIHTLFDCKINRDLSDYIHSTQRLINLSGRKLSKKKNLIAQFTRLYGEYDLVELFPNYISEVIEFAELGAIEGSKNYKEELMALKKACEYYKELAIHGNVLLVKNKVAAFSIYSTNIDATCLIHFEKSNYHYKGASQVINKAVAKALYDKYQCEYLNREQDLGVEGLRKNKLSYDPDVILDNYFLKPK